MIKNPKFLSQHPQSASGRWPGRDRHLPDKQNLCHGRRENQSIKHGAGVKPAQIGTGGERQLQMGISPFYEKALKVSVSGLRSRGAASRAHPHGCRERGREKHRSCWVERCKGASALHQGLSRRWVGDSQGGCVGQHGWVGSAELSKTGIPVYGLLGRQRVI